MNREALHERLVAALDRDADIALLQGAVGRQSVTGNEANFVEFLVKKMQELRLEPQTDDFLPQRPNVWGWRPGAGDGPTLLFVGHTDTVHVRGWKEHWADDTRSDPFSGAVVDGELWGRGSGDLKAGICTSLAALRLLDRAGLTLKGTVTYAFVGDEESGEPGTGVSAGIKHYVATVEAANAPRPDFAVYVEPTSLDVYPAQMGFFIADIVVRGKSAYFGVPERGVDALKATHKLLAAIWAHSDEISQRAAHKLVGQAFVLVTELSGGGYIAVPGECRFSLIRKLLPSESLDKAVLELETILGSVSLQDGISFEITYPAGRDHPLGGSPAEIDPAQPEINQLANAVRQLMPDRGRVLGAPYWSESPFLVNHLDCPTVYCAPGDITNCHTLMERVNLDEYAAGVVAFASFIATYCGVIEDNKPNTINREN